MRFRFSCFFASKYCSKKKTNLEWFFMVLDSFSPHYLLLFTMIYIITWSTFVADSWGAQYFDHVTMYIVVNKSPYHVVNSSTYLQVQCSLACCLFVASCIIPRSSVGFGKTGSCSEVLLNLAEELTLGLALNQLASHSENIKAAAKFNIPVFNFS